jgi:hypothetical protein
LKKSAKQPLKLLQLRLACRIYSDRHHTVSPHLKRTQNPAMVIPKPI